MPMDTASLSNPDFPLSILSSRSHSLYSTREPVPGTPSYNLIPTPSNSLLMLTCTAPISPRVAASIRFSAGPATAADASPSTSVTHNTNSTGQVRAIKFLKAIHFVNGTRGPSICPLQDDDVRI